MGAHDGTLRGPATNFDALLDDTPSEIVEGNSTVTTEVAGDSRATVSAEGQSRATPEVAGDSRVDEE